jgi:hypothetical protein
VLRAVRPEIKLPLSRYQYQTRSYNLTFSQAAATIKKQNVAGARTGSAALRTDVGPRAHRPVRAEANACCEPQSRFWMHEVCAKRNQYGEFYKRFRVTTNFSETLGCRAASSFNLCLYRMEQKPGHT